MPSLTMWYKALKSANNRDYILTKQLKEWYKIYPKIETYNKK